MKKITLKTTKQNLSEILYDSKKIYEGETNEYVHNDIQKTIERLEKIYDALLNKDFNKIGEWGKYNVESVIRLLKAINFEIGAETLEDKIELVKKYIHYIYYNDYNNNCLECYACITKNWDYLDFKKKKEEDEYFENVVLKDRAYLIFCTKDKYLMIDAEEYFEEFL